MTEAVWLALAVLAIPLVLLLATTGCGSFIGAPEEAIELPPKPPSQKLPPEPRTRAGEDFATEAGYTPAPPTYSETVVNTPGLIAYWRLDETQSMLSSPGTAKAVNSFAKGVLDGTYVTTNGIALEVKGALEPKDVNTAARFSGGYVEVPWQSAVNPDEVTLELWIKVDAASDWRVLMGCHQPDIVDTRVLRGYRLRSRAVTSASGLSIQVQGTFGGMATPLEVEVPAGQPTKWHHIVLTYSKMLGMEKSELSVDKQIKSAPGKCELVLTSPQPLRFAANIPGFFQPITTYIGSLDEVALYGLYMDPGVVGMHFNRATA